MMKNNKKAYMAIFITMLFLLSAIVPTALSKNATSTKGFDKGPSYLPVVPIQKTTMVQFDKESYLDDYSYLAAVPTTIFREEGKLYSNPLIFFQEPFEYNDETDEDRTLDAYQGIDYFMKDWYTYCNSEFDQMTLINMDKSKLSSEWDNSKEYTTIKGDTADEIANMLALEEFSYSDDAVLAVIDESFEKGEETTGTFEGTLDIDKEIATEHFEVEQTNKLNPVSNEFDVPEGYNYLYANVWYPSTTIKIGLPFLGIGFFDNLANFSIPSGDKDLQLYCQWDGDWMQVLAIDEWNQKFGMNIDNGGTYIHNTGRWRATVTDVPTKEVYKYGTFLERLQSMRKVIYQVDIEMYPGDRISLFEELPFDCKDITIELKPDNEDLKLGFCLIGPGGEEIASSTEGEIHLEELGQCLPGESYDIVLYSKEGEKGSYGYTIDYSYSQGKTRYESDCLSAATQGAILASTHNAPLLYVNPEEVTQETIDVIYKLGVNNIHLVNIGDHLKEKQYKKLKDSSEKIVEYKEETEVYDAIRSETNSNDIIFSTIDSWNPWHVYELYTDEVKDEVDMPCALHIGPAAYLAAHHGSPVLIVDNTPELSSAVVWHNEFWKKTARFPKPPTVANMYLTGKRVWSYLEELGFDEIGLESIATVAGQFNIGVSWDRVYNGVATPGRFIGTPVDSSYWISRDMFYPAMIFVNPATNSEGVVMSQGSHSERRTLFPWTPLGLKITQPETQEVVQYPVHYTFVHYEHRFNERASKYWGYTYQCADGLTPGKDYTNNPIDEGVSMTYLGEEGSLFPDMSMTDVIPAYLEKGGYGGAYSTSFDKTLENVNNGVLLWVHLAHGGHVNGGTTQFWSGTGKEKNPWRMYELILGSTEEPDTMSLEIHGLIPMLLGNPNMNGLFRSAMDFAPARLPLRDLIGKIASLPIINIIAPDWLEDTDDYYDGMINTALFSQIGSRWYTGVEFDDATENLHSAGFIANSCLMGTKYLHLSMIRHGASYQVIDPWSTSWYSAVWIQSMPRDIILGDTVGEAFNRGISHVGILYLGGAGPAGDEPQWWWDNHENVVYFGDPDLRMYVPSTEYSDKNTWEREDVESMRYDIETDINGHMPFGATEYPNEKEPTGILSDYMGIIIVVIAVIILLVALAYFSKKKR